MLVLGGIFRSCQVKASLAEVNSFLEAGGSQGAELGGAVGTRGAGLPGRAGRVCARGAGRMPRTCLSRPEAPGRPLSRAALFSHLKNASLHLFIYFPVLDSTNRPRIAPGGLGGTAKLLGREVKAESQFSGVVV